MCVHTCTCIPAGNKHLHTQSHKIQTHICTPPFWKMLLTRPNRFERISKCLPTIFFQLAHPFDPISGPWHLTFNSVPLPSILWVYFHHSLSHRVFTLDWSIYWENFSANPAGTHSLISSACLVRRFEMFWGPHSHSRQEAHSSCSQSWARVELWHSSCSIYKGCWPSPGGNLKLLYKAGLKR